MEFLNKVIIRGKVGAIKVADVQGKKLTRFTIATNCYWKDKQGAVVIETTWHQVEGWDIADEYNKNDNVEVEGRLKQQRYTDGLGEYHTTYIVVANSIKKIEENLEFPF